MKMFIPMMLVTVWFVFGLMYLSQFRGFIRTHGWRIAAVILGASTTLFALFSLLSLSTWRLF